MHYDTTKLIRMAKQMADFFRNQPDRPAAQAVAAHINDNWAPVMRRDFVALIRSGAEADPIVREAADLVRLPATDAA
ncbi:MULTISPECIES: formate dehydrogenase subunit delta [Paracoccus]|jgi:formate dehydrogenase subunit delta|uniref:Formate dehydrogenase n=2 Tax=Paracoccus TaxID=265 RepID=A0A2D2BVW6_9RHOB|nr:MULTISPECIES: formate dehydrogenase subunit delta [Paracoccus]ATQ54370.1 formate dehydrogenase [Paracoccus yeei]AWX92505.1 formate dehydrogenase [Paracoccus mutanolyticus]AYF01693.1 formate dehydrogenase [Paracoccus yeei]MBY0136606.1 formate dehydrogenase subunit delta [Paracoccus yeei]OWJ94348.1 formate dehydrogenase [Paracoccus yeei]